MSGPRRTTCSALPTCNNVADGAKETMQDSTVVAIELKKTWARTRCQPTAKELREANEARAALKIAEIEIKMQPDQAKKDKVVCASNIKAAPKPHGGAIGSQSKEPVDSSQPVATTQTHQGLTRQYAIADIEELEAAGSVNMSQPRATNNKVSPKATTTALLTHS